MIECLYRNFMYLRTRKEEKYYKFLDFILYLVFRQGRKGGCGRGRGWENLFSPINTYENCTDEVGVGSKVLPHRLVYVYTEASVSSLLSINENSFSSKNRKIYFP